MKFFSNDRAASYLPLAGELYYIIMLYIMHRAILYRIL